MTKRNTLMLLAMVTLAMPAAAQPGSVKKAAKNIIKISTFKLDGSLLRTGYGIIVGEDGTAITSWTPFYEAGTAVAFDTHGRKYDIEYIYGASEMYNVAKIKLANPDNKEFDFTEIDASQQAAGSEAWVAGYDVKSPMYKKTSPKSVESFDSGLPYYIFEQETPDINETMAGCPVLNAEGKLLGLVNTSNTRTDFYAASARYAMQLTPTALSGNNNVLRYTNVNVALPAEYSQAVVALYVSQRKTLTNYLNTVNNFIKQFPDKEDGYVNKAEFLAFNGNIPAADSLMQVAMEKVEDKEHLHYSYSKMIYNQEQAKPDTISHLWSYDKALDEIDATLATRSLPLYHAHKGKVLMAQQKWQEALTEFTTVNQTQNYRDAEAYFLSYQCLRNLKAKRAEQLVPLDSATVIDSTNVFYLAEKALLLLKMNRADEAVSICRRIVGYAPGYADGNGLLGVALCYAKRKEEGLKQLEYARKLGYAKADEYINAFKEQ